MTSIGPYSPRANDWLLGISVALTAGVIAGFAPITSEFGVESVSGVTTALGIVGALGLLTCWIVGSFSIRRPYRSVPWLVVAVALWGLQIVVLSVIGWRIAVPTAGFLAALVLLVGWFQLHRYVPAAYAWLAVLAAGGILAGVAWSYPILAVALFVAPLLTVVGAISTQILAARRQPAA